MKIRYLFFLLITLATSACGSTHSFNNEQEFISYVSKLQLSELTLQLAISKVSAEGFICSLQQNTSYCVREAQGLVCNQKQIIILSSPPINNTSLTVSSKFGLVCL